MSIDRIPLHYPGRLYRSPMPFSGMDMNNAWEGYRAEQVQVVVMLASREECMRVTGFDLPELYRSAGMEIIYSPIPDFGIIGQTDLKETVEQVISALQAGKNVAAHCHAGRGRTGMLLACVLRAAEGLSGEEAIRRIRTIVPGAVETSLQEKVVNDFNAGGDNTHANH